jgi:hypothetical protein
MRVTSGNIEAACAGYCWVMVSKTTGSTPLIQEFVLENEDTFAATGANLSFVPMLAVVTHLSVPGSRAQIPSSSLWLHSRVLSIVQTRMAVSEVIPPMNV